MTAGIAHSDLEHFRTAVQARLGLYFDEGRLGDLSDVLRARMLATHSASVSAYLARVDDAELGGLAERLTVGETYFFRYHQQFSALSEIVLPTVLREAAGRPVRILSAGCATGDEAYSIAIALRELGAAFPELAVAAGRAEVRAFDVNPAVLARAQQARYSEWSLRETPATLRQRYFTNDAQHLLAPEIRAMVRFERRNLIDEDPAFWAPASFDVVFCRNVIMYFDAETARAVVARLTRALRPGGFLFLGHAETLRGLSADYHLCHTHETFYYQRKGVDVSAPRLARETPPSTGTEPISQPVPINAALGLEQTSWIDTIQQASDRIARLTTPGAKTPAAVRAKAAIVDGVDTKPVLDMMRQERFVDALALLGTFSQNDPETQLLRAVLLTNSGELAKAEQTCAALLARDELHAGAHYLMALCREHAGDADAAREYDRIASYLDPAFAMPHLHVGILERRAGNTASAAVELHRALELLGAEDAARILLFGGGFSRETLALLCQNELRRCGGAS